MFGWIKRLFSKRKSPVEAFVDSLSQPPKANPWRGQMPKPLVMAPTGLYQPDPSWKDPAPRAEEAQPRRLVPNMQPGRTGRRVADDRRTTFSPAPYNPLTDIESPLNPISPLYAALEQSYAPPAPAASDYCAAPPPDTSSGIDFGSSSGGCDTSGGGW